MRFICTCHESFLANVGWMSNVKYEWVMSRMNESCHVWMSHVTYEWVMSHMNESCHIWMSHVTYEWIMSHMNESCHIWMSHVTYEWVMSHMNESCHIWMNHTGKETRVVPATHIWLQSIRNALWPSKLRPQQNQPKVRGLQRWHIRLFWGKECRALLWRI